VQAPRPDLDIHAWIGESFPRDAHLSESRSPRGVDLHETKVVAPIGVVVNGSRVEVALSLGDGPEEPWRDAVDGSRLLIAESVCRIIETDNSPSSTAKMSPRMVPHLYNHEGGRCSCLFGYNFCNLKNIYGKPIRLFGVQRTNLCYQREQLPFFEDE